jgi:ketosteroid isomerase-like protein
MIALFAAALVAATASAGGPPDLLALLRAKDQVLLDATATGDRAVWEAALAADALYVDENGEVLDRAAFLKVLEPLPAGTSGHISIVDYQVRSHGDTALVLLRMDEREDYHGQPLHADYLLTETWMRQGEAWRLELVHAYVVAKDPPAVSLPASRLDEYVGRYDGTGGLTYEIRRDGDHLVGGRPGAAARTLSAEVQDVLFIAGRPRSRKIFQRDAQGQVTGFLDRQEGEDLVYRRVAVPEAQALPRG